MENLTPTKSNLMKAKSLLDFSKQGYVLLDKKRTVLIREIMMMIDEVDALQVQIDEVFREVYIALEHANVTIGSDTMEELSYSVPYASTFEKLGRSIMNVEIPLIRYEAEKIKPHYGFFRTNSAVDLVLVQMNEAQKLIFRMAEVENAVYRLALEIRSTNKRANALEKIQIPKYETLVSWILESLEEREREDFFRMKRFKGKK